MGSKLFQSVVKYIVYISPQPSSSSSPTRPTTTLPIATVASGSTPISPPTIPLPKGAKLHVEIWEDKVEKRERERER